MTAPTRTLQAPRRPSVPLRSAPPAARARRPGRPHRRVTVMVVVGALGLCAVGVRLVQLQVLDAARYQALGLSQRVRTAVLPADRGAIYDRNGAELVLSVPRRTIWADPGQVYDPMGYANALAPLLGIAPEQVTTLAERLGREGSQFVYVARKVDDATADAVKALDLPGIGFLDESARLPTSDDLARSVLGRVDIDSKGISGVELAFDSILAGTPGELLSERDQRGRTIPVGEHRLVPAEPGDGLVLTIDRGLQFAVEQTLVREVSALGAKGAMAIVMDPSTGDILTMANVVQPEEGGPPVPASANKAVTDAFEPGSVNKVITASAAIEEGLVQPGTVLTVPDRLQVYDHTFSDHDPHPPTDWTVDEVLTLSSNIGAIKLAQMLGKARLDDYLRAFGLGERTALGFPGESSGILPEVPDWSGTSIATIAMGQGVSVTALQMLMAYNVIANEGRYVAPRLVSATVDGNGRREPAEAAPERRVLSAETAAKMNLILRNVVREGTGVRAMVDGYTVAGKTGTARKPQPGGGYQDEAGNYHYVATFAGFVPAEAPELSIIVVIDEPTTTYYASGTAAPVFREVAQFALRHLRIPPPAGAMAVDAPTTVAADVPAVGTPLPGDRSDAGG